MLNRRSFSRTSVVEGDCGTRGGTVYHGDCVGCGSEEHAVLFLVHCVHGTIHILHDLIDHAEFWLARGLDHLDGDLHALRDELHLRIRPLTIEGTRSKGGTDFLTVGAASEGVRVVLHLELECGVDGLDSLDAGV